MVFNPALFIWKWIAIEQKGKSIVYIHLRFDLFKHVNVFNYYKTYANEIWQLIVAIIQVLDDLASTLDWRCLSIVNILCFDIKLGV